MPQRLVKTPGQAGQALEVNGRALSAAHEQIVSILRSRLGQNHGELLAAPKAEPDGGIVWSTALAGAVGVASELPDDDRARLRQRAERIVGEIRGLAEQLRGEGPAAQLVAQMLERAVQTPPGDWLYSVGGKPVLVMWGHAAVGAPVVPLPAAAAAAASAPAAATPPGGAGEAGAAGAAGAAVPPPAPEPPRRRWLRWLLWGLLGLALLALLLWGLRRCSDAPLADAALAEQLAQAEGRNRAIEEEIARWRGQRAPMECVADAPPPAPPASAPEPAVPVVPASAPSPEPRASVAARDPLDSLKQRIAGADCSALQQMLTREPALQGSDPKALALKQQVVAALAKNCREKLIQEAKNLCPDQRPKDLAPELVIVFDASGSMNFSLTATEREIEQAGAAEAVQNMMRQFGLGGGAGAAVLERLTREPRRITVAKQATAAIVQRVPSDMNIGLVQVEQCPSARSVGYFGPGQRGALLGHVQAIQPRAGTPLADGVARAGQMLDGVKRESVMLVISDGKESCGQDPCAVAEALARAKPHLKINVVDITGTGAGNCLARATRGKVFTANNADEVVAMTKRAAQDAMGPANCRTP